MQYKYCNSEENAIYDLIKITMFLIEITMLILRMLRSIALGAVEIRLWYRDA